MIKPRYKLDLKAYMALCEANYLKCMQLLTLELDDSVYKVELPDGETAQIALHVTERCKYTTMLTLSKTQSSPWLADLHFDLRLYHDAKGLEITRFQRQRIKHARYNYPNEKMFQQDEKVQHQGFLAECLAYCLQYGLSDVKLRSA